VQVKADEYCELLRDAMMGNTFVKELKLANCDIKCRGAAALGELLAANHTLQVRTHPSTTYIPLHALIRSQTGLDSRFQVGLSVRADPADNMAADGVWGGTKQVFDLEKNNIREAGGVALAGGLAKNTSVRVVNLLSQQQPPGDAVCVAFVELFDTNVTLLKVRTPPTPRSPHPLCVDGGQAADA